MSLSFSNYSIDVDNKKIINLIQGNAFGFSTWPSKYFSNLILSNEEKTYLFSFLEQKSESNYYYLSLQKFQFYNFNISQNQNYKILNSSKLRDSLI